MHELARAGFVRGGVFSRSEESWPVDSWGRGEPRSGGLGWRGTDVQDDEADRQRAVQLGWGGAVSED